MEECKAKLLLLRAKECDGDAFAELCRVYDPLISAEVARHGTECSESDREDMRQVALMAFYNAVRSFDLSQSDVRFGLYGKICITNALVSHLRHLHHRVQEVPMSDQMADSAFSSAGDDPAAMVMEEEALEGLRARIRRLLSPYENRVWNLYAAGYRSGEIAEILGRDSHSIENAVYRIRAKLRAALR